MMFVLRTYFYMVYGFEEYNHGEEIGVALNLLKLRPPPPPQKKKKNSPTLRNPNFNLHSYYESRHTSEVT